jgi:type III restriction enzyme
MPDTARFRNEDLVLTLRRSIDPAQFDIGKYEAFLDVLCGEREYQKEAIRNVCNFLFGGAYSNTQELAEENWHENDVLQEKYANFDRMQRALQFPDRLSCSVDLATGTGKSFVIYAIARIALAEGKVDRVLVLCPSNTIEAGLLAKFRDLARESDLTDILPSNSVIATPHIIDATESITRGTICVENIHATYKATKSAITDSLKGKGERTLVLNDEAHHIYSPERDRGLKKWKEFLLADDFGFRYLVGLSGTCYIKNEYFTDVVSRYSLRKAIEEGFVKSIDYVVEDSPGDQYEKWQKIYANHKAACRKYRKIKPLTIIVTKDIASCKRVEDELLGFLVKQEKLTREDAVKKVMRVHTPRSSGKGAKEDKRVAANIVALRNGDLDDKKNPVEWICSVSMLTEGWDVQNVFQIYPHEKRAFESKLLIAQVLGRGLRVPESYRGERPVVTVYNHDSWSHSIKDLVNEVLEIERRVYSFPVVKKPNYNFEIHQIDYSKTPEVVETEQESEYNFDMEFVQLAAQSDELERETEYESAVSGMRRTRNTRVQIQMYPVEQMVLEITNKFRAIDMEAGTSYAKRYPAERIRKMIRASLDRIGYKGDAVSKENKQRILSAFGNLKRAGSKSIRYLIEAKSLYTVSTTTRPKDSVGLGVLRRKVASVFYDELSKKFDVELAQAINDIEQDDTYPRRALTYVDNRFYFKTCLSVVLTHAEPEFKFVKALVQQKNAEKIQAWIKSSDIGFYEIEYSYPRGDYSKRGTFNPDFFISLGKEIIVVEIKGDEEIDEPSAENRGKRRAAIEHFTRLNDLQNDINYHFCFLSPKDFDVFFAHLREGNVMRFQSSLDVALMNGTVSSKKKA